MDVLLNVSGRPPLGWKMLWIIAISCIFVYIGEHNLTGYDFLDTGIDKDTVAYLTFGLAFLLTWRLGQSYVRYNDARVKWGMMVNRTRDLTRQFWGYCSDKTINQRATKWIIAYVHACKQSLRWKKQCNELYDLLDDDEILALNNCDHMPIYCMEQITECINEATRKGLIDTIQAQTLDANITGFEDYIGASERLLKTPVPFGFVLHLRFVMILYIIITPLFLMKELRWGAVPVTAIFAYTLTGLEDISQEIENPFRQAWHCLPIDGICKAIKGNCLEIQSRYLAAAADSI
jgi:putative membrane protein